MEAASPLIMHLRRAGMARRAVTCLVLILLTALLTPLFFGVSSLLGVGNFGSSRVQTDFYVDADGSLLDPLPPPSNAGEVEIGRAHV